MAAQLTSSPPAPRGPHRIRWIALTLAITMIAAAGLYVALQSHPGARTPELGSPSGLPEPPTLPPMPGQTVPPTSGPEKTPTPQPTLTVAPRPRLDTVRVIGRSPVHAPEAVEGLEDVTLTEAGPHAESVTWPRAVDLYGADDAVTRFTREHRSRTAYASRQGDSTYETGYRTVLTSGPWLGLQLTAFSQTPAWPDGREVTASVYLNVTTDEAFAGTDLLTDDAKEQLLPAFNWALAQVNFLPDAAGGHGTQTGDVFADVRISASGDVHVVVSAGLLTPVAQGVRTFLVPAADAEPLLTPAGVELRETVMAGADFAGIPVPVRPDCAVLKCIALTFDDGPNKHTPAVLDALSAERVPATFFLLGMQVKGHEAMIERMVEEGHDVGGHSWNHKDLSRLSAKELADQMARTDAAISGVTGRPVVWERPPYGNTNDAVLKAMKSRGKAMVLWNVDTEDWKNRDVKKTTKLALTDARPNSIVLMHDIRPTTGEALPGIIEGLREEGYTFVTLSDVLQPEPGAVHHSLKK